MGPFAMYSGLASSLRLRLWRCSTSGLPSSFMWLIARMCLQKPMCENTEHLPSCRTCIVYVS